MTSKRNLSAVIITKNEEKNIIRCIKSISFADEIIVFDSESTDKTVKIAKELGAKVIIHPWTGNYSEQRNLADKYASNEWILQIDADEVVSDELKEELINFLASEQTYEVGAIPRKEFFINKWIEYGGWYPQYKIRLYKKGSGYWTGRVHENYKTNKKVFYFKNPILHYSYLTIEIFLDKFNKYSSYDAQEAVVKNEKFSMIKLFFQPIERFIGRYFFKKGYKDGFHGFICAFVIALNYFLRQIKIWEIRNKNN